MNVPVAEPAGMVTVAGTAAIEDLLLERPTTAPPAGATPPRVTVAVLELPPVTVDGLSETPVTVSGFTVSVAICVPLYVPMIATAVVELTGVVVTGNDAEVAPAVTVTEAGGAATDELLLLRVTSAPPDGAGPFRVAVPVTPVPPPITVGFSVIVPRLVGATEPSTAISARPMFEPVALFTVNCIQVTVL